MGKFIGAITAAMLVSVTLASAHADVFPGSSIRLIQQGELQNLTCEQLWVARNEIFARNGYRFKSRRGQQYFGTSGWTSNPTLNRTEQRNVANIKAIENRFC